MSWATDPGFAELKTFLIQATGLDYYTLKNDDLFLRLTRRFSEVACSDCTTYLQVLKNEDSSAREMDAVIHELTIGETYFFRHQEQFDTISQVVLPECLIRSALNKRLRIWSAGCSTGAEPYSIAMLLKQKHAHELQGWDVEIVGTDINQEALRKARSGVFEEWAFRAIPELYRQNYFERQDRKSILAKEIRERVSFQYQNLVMEPFVNPFGESLKLDLILCRNVTIYFDRSTCERIIREFYKHLAPGGWLIVGHSESNIEFFQKFEVVAGSSAIVYRKPLESNLGVLAPLAWTSLPLNSEPAVLPAFVSHPVPSFQSIQSHAALGNYASALHDCDQLLITQKLDPALHLWRGRLLEELESGTESEKAFKRCIYLKRDFVLAHYYYALFLERKNLLEGARREFQIVLGLLDDLDPSLRFSEVEGKSVAELKLWIRNRGQAA